MWSEEVSFKLTKESSLSSIAFKYKVKHLSLECFTFALTASTTEIGTWFLYGILTLIVMDIWHNNLLLVVLIKNHGCNHHPAFCFAPPIRNAGNKGCYFYYLPTYLPTYQQPTFLYTNHLSFICSHNNHLPIVLLGTYYLQEFFFSIHENLGYQDETWELLTNHLQASSYLGCIHTWC
jgi:hypothetical protein